MKFRIFGARTQAPDEFRATGEVPSPTLDSMIDHVAHPENHTFDLVKQEADLAAYQQPNRPITNGPPVPDMTEAIRESRKEK